MKVVKVRSGLGGLGMSSGNASEIICKSLKKYELNENYETFNFEIDEVKVVDGNVDETGLNIYCKAKKARNCIFVGGDHSLTYHSFKGFAEGFSNPGLIIFDAHPDCEVGTESVSHEDFVRKLINDRILKKNNLILIGIRNISKNELRFLKEHKIMYFTMKQIYGNIREVCYSAMETLREFDGFYLSLDIDVLDSSVAPGVGYREPGGFSVRELIYFLQRLKLLKNFYCCDLVEVNPERDINGLTVDIGVKLIWEMYRKDF